MDVDRPHILVVDDTPDTADSMAVMLGLWGYDGEARYGGVAALAAARARPPAVVLLDLEMPGMGGFEFVGRLRELCGCDQTAVVVMSGYTTESYQARARELGIDHYLFKPADPGLLQTLLKGLVVIPAPPRARTQPRPRYEVCATR